VEEVGLVQPIREFALTPRASQREFVMVVLRPSHLTSACAFPPFPQALLSQSATRRQAKLQCMVTAKHAQMEGRAGKAGLSTSDFMSRSAMVLTPSPVDNMDSVGMADFTAAGSCAGPLAFFTPLTNSFSSLISFLNALSIADVT
jgi:hypothetical protein